jgi:iron complex outermembrane receptor protein
VVDLEARLSLANRVNLAVGAENLFDEYPDAYTAARNATGNTPFSNYAPFGRSGRFVYGRMSVAF